MRAKNPFKVGDKVEPNPENSELFPHSPYLITSVDDFHVWLDGKDFGWKYTRFQEYVEEPVVENQWWNR